MGCHEPSGQVTNATAVSRRLASIVNRCIDVIVLDEDLPNGRVERDGSHADGEFEEFYMSMVRKDDLTVVCCVRNLIGRRVLLDRVR